MRLITYQHEGPSRTSAQLDKHIIDLNRAYLEFIVSNGRSFAQKPDGSFPQNSLVDSTPHWTNIQLDEVADPIILAYQLGRIDTNTWSHVKRAADLIIGFHQDGHAAPWTQEEHWENQSGYSPATIASEIAGLVCAAEIAKANGDTASAQRYLATADSWQAQVENWTVTTNGLLSLDMSYPPSR